MDFMCKMLTYLLNFELFTQKSKILELSTKYLSNNINSSKMNWAKFSHIELDFDYSVYKNKYILDKILLKKIQHVESVY